MDRPNYERLVEWFTYNMPMEMRHKLMAELPVEYHKLNPDVDPAIILAAVRRAITHAGDK